MYNDVILATGDVYYEYHDQGMKVLCFRCMSQVATDGLRCDMCAYKHKRLIGVIPLDA